MIWPGDDKPDDPADEARLFRDAVRDVRPLKSGAPPQRAPRVRPRARFTRADRAAVLRESLDGTSLDPAVAGGEELVFHSVGLFRLLACLLLAFEHARPLLLGGFLGMDVGCRNDPEAMAGVIATA